MIKIDYKSYLSLRRKSDDIEVYTSPFENYEKNLKFYFERVNSGIQQQLESPRLTDEQKSQLKLLEYKDYNIAEMELWNEGGWHEKRHWTMDFEEFLNKTYKNI